MQVVPNVLDYYKLNVPLLDLPEGTVFCHIEHSKFYPDLGNIGCGALLLCWELGSCQSDWSGGAFALPGQYADSKFFERISNSNKRYTPPKVDIMDINTTVTLSDGVEIKLPIEKYIELEKYKYEEK